MLFRSFEGIKQEDYWGIPVRGIVVDNEDPLFLGRVKCEIAGRWPIGQYEKLPWISPFSPFGLGGKITNSSFSVPEIESELIIIFPYKMEYLPFYIGYFQSTVTHQGILFDEDYPETYGFCDRQMFWTRVNKLQEYIELFHYAGLTVRMFDEGEVHINIPKNLIINVGEDLLVKVLGKEVWEIDKTSSKIVTEDLVLQVDGKANYIYNSGEYKEITGKYELKVIGDFDSSVTGHKSSLVTGYFDQRVINYYAINSGAFSVNSLADFRVQCTGTYSLLITGAYINNTALTHSTNAASITENPLAIQASGPASLTPINAISQTIEPPLDPIGHGTLAERIAELEAKVEELLEIDVMVKALEEAFKPDRLMLTSLGGGEFVMPDVAPVIPVSPANINLSNDINEVTALLNNLSESDVQAIQNSINEGSFGGALSLDNIELLKSNIVQNVSILKSIPIETSYEVLSSILNLVQINNVNIANLEKFSKNITNKLTNLISTNQIQSIATKQLQNVIDTTVNAKVLELCNKLSGYVNTNAKVVNSIVKKLK